MKYNSRIRYPAWHSSWQISPKVWRIISPFKTPDLTWLWMSLLLLLANTLFKAWYRKTFSFPLETKYSSEKTVDKMEFCKRTSPDKISHIAYVGYRPELPVPCTWEEIISISNFSDSVIKRLQNTRTKLFDIIKLCQHHISKLNSMSGHIWVL